MKLTPEIELIKNEFSISDEEFLKRAADCVAWAEHYVADGKTESLIPQLTIWTKDGPDAEEKVTLAALMVDFNTDEEKRLTMTGMGIRTAQESTAVPTCVLFASEAWVTKSQQFSGGPDGHQPKDDPARGEALVVMGLSVAERKFCQAVALVQRLDGMIQPVKFEAAPEIVDQRFLLLDWFVEGYLMGVAKKHGWKP